MTAGGSLLLSGDAGIMADFASFAAGQRRLARNQLSHRGTFMAVATAENE